MITIKDSNKIDLLDYLVQSYDILVEELTLRRHLTSLLDGQRPVNSAIMQSLSLLSNDTTKSFKSVSVVSNAMDKFHYHGEEYLYGTLIRMGVARLPLVSCVKDSDTISAFDPRTGTKKSMRYTSASFTYFGREYVTNSRTSPKVRNYTNLLYMKEYFTSMIPYILFQTYWGITEGIFSMLLPLCPEEIFNAMIAMIETNGKISTVDLAKHIKGCDISEDHIVLMNSQALYALLEEGDACINIISALKVDIDTIEIKAAPVGMTFKNLRKQFEEISAKTKNGFSTFKVTASAFQNDRIVINYENLNNSSIAEITAEIYLKTSLSSIYTFELTGLLPLSAGEKRLHKMSVREILMQAIKFGYDDRIAEINEKIDALEKSREFNSVFEKMTRPTTLAWFRFLIDKGSGGTKEMLLKEMANIGDTRSYARGWLKSKEPVDTVIHDVEIGGILIKGGLTDKEIDMVFSKTRGSIILTRLEERASALLELNNYIGNLQGLQEQLKPHNVLKYLKTKLKEYASKPICKRRSKVLYKDDLEFNSKSRDNIRMATDVYSNIVVQNQGILIVYTDKTVMWCYDIKPPFDNIAMILNYSDDLTLYLLTTAKKYKITDLVLNKRVNLMDYTNNNPLMGIFTSSTSKTYLFVTNFGRCKKITGESLYQSHKAVDGFALYPREHITNIHTLNEEECNSQTLTVELLTAKGVKRVYLKHIGVADYAGYKSAFTSKTPIVLDSRLVSNADSVVPVTTKRGFEFITIKSVEAHKRNVSLELEIVDDARILKYIQGYQYYASMFMVNCMGELIEKFVNETPNFSTDYIRVNEVNSLESFEESIGLENANKLKSFRVFA